MKQNKISNDILCSSSDVVGSGHIAPNFRNIKLIIAILSIVILIFTFIIPHVMWQWHARTFLIVMLTCGFLLGWALPSVLNRFLTFHKSDVIIYTITAVLTIISLIFCLTYVVDNEYYSQTECYRIMFGITICVFVEAIICLFLISWILIGNYTIVENR